MKKLSKGVPARPKACSQAIKFPDVQSNGWQTSIDSAFTPRKKILAQAKVSLRLCSRPIDLTPRTLFRGQRLSGHPRKASIIVPFCFSPVIDPFSQMKREYVLYWTIQTLRIVSTLSHLRALHNALQETSLKVTKNEI